jgi:tetratricopeptide (TPR) repeat protein
VQPAATQVVGALARAIRAEASPSRVLITCRYPLDTDPHPARLVQFGLAGLQGADLDKKARQLPHIVALDDEDPVRRRGLAVAGGNPRLLHRLDAALDVDGLDADDLLARVEATTEAFRESVIATALHDALPGPSRAAMAALSVCRLPVDRPAALAITGQDGPALDRAAGSTLVESTPDPSSGGTAYRVAPVAQDLAGTGLTAADRDAALGRAFAHLREVWWEGAGGVSEERALELVRLGLAVGDVDKAGEVARVVLIRWVHEQSRFAEAVELAERVLVVADHAGVRYWLARAQIPLGETTAAAGNLDRALAACPDSDEQLRGVIINAMAGLAAQAGDTARAMDLYQDSLAIKERIGDAQGKAATLHQMAGLAAQAGDTARAMDLYQDSMAINERIGNAQGKAATIHQMAVLAAQAGDTARAMDLYQDSLAIDERIGNAQGKAATLHQMAGLAAQAGDTARAMDLYQDTLTIDERIGNAQGKAATLHQMAGLAAQAGDTARAMDLYQDSLATWERIGDAQGKAATLHQMAGLAAQAGDTARAMDLYQDSMAIKERIGDAQGKAATLHQMAGLAAQAGDTARAMDLYQDSMAIKERIGDAQGKAATLAQMGFMAAQAGDTEAALRSSREALGVLAGIGAWPDAAIVVSNIAKWLGDPVESVAQAAWLHLRVDAPPSAVTATLGRLAGLLGPGHPATGLLAATTLTYLTGPSADTAQPGAVAAIEAATGHTDWDDPAATRTIIDRVAEQGGDPTTLRARALAACHDLVPPDTWHIDTTQLPHP